MNPNTVLFLLLGVILLDSMTSAVRRGGGRKPQNDYQDEESCEDDDGYDEDRRAPRVGSVREPEQRHRYRDVAPDDDDGVIDDPTDDDYLRYENPRENGICLLQRGKCPNGEWKMFQRKNETVCLKLFGTPHTVDRLTAGKICRQTSNARLMMINSQAEREWMYGLPIHNGTYPYVLLGGYRNRKCQVNPYIEECKVKLNAFVHEDATADPVYAFTTFTGGPLNWMGETGRYDDCPMLHFTTPVTDMFILVRDWKCIDHHLFLCGITVM